MEKSALHLQTRQGSRMDDANAPLVDAWIALHQAQPGSPVHEANLWAFSTLDKVCWNAPLDALSIIKAIWDTDQTPAMAENLSAGPLEDVLARHGQIVIDHVEAHASSDTSFAYLLGGVWDSRIEPGVWQRVEKVRIR